jgi:Flp pilus assembly protein TadB
VIALSALAGALTALGVLLISVGLAGGSLPSLRPLWRRLMRRRARDPAARAKDRRRRAVLLIAVPPIALAMTGWPVAALIAAAGIWWLPRVLGGRRAAEARIARLEALADWTRRLADVLTAGAGIEQAVQASLASTPAPIGREVGVLVARLRARRPTEEALRAFGDDLDDPTADLVVAALLLAADRRGRGLARLLTGLASTVEAEVAMRRGVEADRAQPRTTARWVTYITIAVAATLLVFDRAYVAPFGTADGQVVLALVAALFAGAFAWMHRLTSSAPTHRFLPQSDGFAPSSTRAGASP